MKIVISTRDTCAAVLVGMAVYSVANAEVQRQLFGVDEPAPLDLGRDPTVVQSRSAVINLGQLSDLRQGDRVLLNLFDDVSFVGVVNRVDRRTWSGVLEHESTGTFTLALRQGRMAAIVRIPPSHTYRVRSLPNGQHLIQPLD